MQIDKELLVKSKDKPQSDTYFTGLAYALPQYVMLIDPDTYTVRFLNQPGAEEGGFVGKNMYDFVCPDHTEIIANAIAEVKKTLQPISLELEGVSSRYSNGKAWYRSQMGVVLDESNGIKDLVFVVEDITRQKQQEEESINKNERIKSIINNTKDIICSIDTNFNLIEFNSVFASMVKLGYHIELEAGMPVLQFTDPSKHEHLKTIYARVLNGESLLEVESFATVNDNLVYNETSYNPIYNANKIVDGINIFSKDITERVKNEQKIKNALKEKEVLLAEIHHRIKNNLAMVSSLLQLQELNTSNKAAKEVLALSRKRIKSTALIHELLYKSESFQKIDLKEYLLDLFDNFKINENIALGFEGESVKLNLSLAMPLGLMLNELLLNSFKHSYTASSKGKIKITCNASTDSLVVFYDDFEGLFSSEIDFHNSNTTGLTLIHTFAKQLNGNIDLIKLEPPSYKIQIPLNENH